MLLSELKKLYESGKTIAEIAKLTCCKRSSCYRILQLQGTTFRKCGKKRKRDDKAISELHNQGYSYREIADKLGISYVTAFNALKSKKEINPMLCKKT